MSLVAEDKTVAATDDGPSRPAPATNVFGEMDFKPNFEALAKNRSPADLRWRDVRLEINGRTILDNVSGSVGSHELLALMGPSGAGKSSLMNLLAGRIAPSKKKKMSGDMLINGQPVNPVKYRRSVAYVMQEDALYATSTGREALEFSAKLRLPSSVTAEERRTIVNELLTSLGVAHVADTMCGSELVRGLSGGEKKRVSIGVELVTSPTLLFLDEPTSGLDSYSAWSVVTILKALSRSGCAVLCSVHQPASEVFSIFDKTTVLSRGKVLYNGSVANIAENLASVGHAMPPLTNPADFVMVLAQTKTDKELRFFDEEKEQRPVATATGHNVAHSSGADDKTMVREGSSIAAANATGEHVATTLPRQSSMWTQSRELLVRETRAVVRDKGALIGRFGISMFLSLLYSLIFFDAGDVNNEDWTLRGHSGALINAFISALFAASQPVLLTLPLERVIFLREYSTGSYSATPYFLTKVAVELVMYFLGALVALLIQFWLINFQSEFMSLLGSTFLVSLVSASYAFLAGSLVSSVKVAQEVAPLLFVPQLLFTGLFISLNQIPEWLRWAQYLCSLKWGLNLAYISEFGGRRCVPDNASPELAAMRIEICHDFLSDNDVDEDDVGLYIGILLAIFVVFRVAALIALVERAKTFT